MVRRRWIVAGLAVIAAGVYFFWPEGKAAPTVQTATVGTGDIDDVVTAQGKLEPKTYVDVGTQVSGQLKKLDVQLGDVVEKGQLIAEIDPTVYQSKVDADRAHLKTLQAQLDQQQATLVQNQLQFNRDQQLVATHAISQQAFEASQAAYKVAQAQVAALKAQIEEEQSGLNGDLANLGYTKIYAPISGTVVVSDIKEGQTVNASQQAPTIVEIANLDIMTVRAQVAEADVTRIEAGMPASFTTLGDMAHKWQGKVRQVLPSPENVNDVVLYDVLIDVDNSAHKLMTGMTTQVFFDVGHAENVTIVPVGALGQRVAAQDVSGTQAYRVRVMQGGRMVPKVVQVGLMDRTNAEIKSGLAAGDVVVLKGAAAASSTQPRGGRRMRGFL